MDSAQDISDSTDWLNTPLKDFAQLENALHCQICKEFYDTPMITSCSHTFCSRCIRTNLSADGRCPACRTSDQASKLRNNWALQEVVATFIAARPAAISVAVKEQEQAAQSRRPGKRKRAIFDSEDIEQAQDSGRTPRSKSRRTTASQTSVADAIEIEDSDDDGVYEPEQPQDDGLVECPLGCGKRMKIEQVEPHLDRCEDERKQERKAKSRTPVNGLQNSRPVSRQSARPQERLAELNYSLLRELTMRKKLEELGIPGWGSKQLMIKRHTEWVNLWNANCDSNHPRSKRELLQDLDTWERTQGGRAPNAQGLTNGVMRKDFDGAGWANKNKDDFSRLIADARRKKSKPATESSSLKDEDAIEDPSKPVLNGDEGSSPHFAMDLTQSAPPQAMPKPSAPYAEHPEAIASVREKVEAANAGEYIEPIIHESLASHQPDPVNPIAGPNGIPPEQPHPAAPRPHSGTDNPALLAQGHFGHDRVPSRDEQSVDGTLGSPYDLAAHLQSSPRKLPRFVVPSEPIGDVGTDGGDGTQV